MMSNQSRSRNTRQKKKKNQFDFLHLCFVHPCLCKRKIFTILTKNAYFVNFCQIVLTQVKIRIIRILLQRHK